MESFSDCAVNVAGGSQTLGPLLGRFGGPEQDDDWKRDEDERVGGDAGSGWHWLRSAMVRGESDGSGRWWDRDDVLAGFDPAPGESPNALGAGGGAW